MFSYTINSIYTTKEISSQSEEFSKAALYQQTINLLNDPTYGMEEAERQNYEQKILQKVKSGKGLTSEELEYLRGRNPEMYRIAMRVEIARKSLKTQLANCRSKEEVVQVLTVRVQVLQTMKNDPAREAMTAMVNEEIKEFQKSSEYAKLPVNEEKVKKEAKEKRSELESCEIDKTEFKRMAVYQRMQFQCDMITGIVQRFLSA